MNVLILGRNHPNSYGLIRSLGEKKHKVYLLLWQEQCNWMMKSKYIDSIICVSTYEEVKNAIISLSSKLSDKPILFVTSDEDANFVDTNYTLLNRYCITEGGRFDGALIPYRSKEKMNKLALDLGLTLPRSWEVTNKTSLPEDISYPVIVKADESFGNWKSVMQCCSTEQELKTHLDAIPDVFFPLIIQEYIEKKHELLILGCAKDGKVCIPVGHKKVRHYPHPYSGAGYSISVEVASDPVISVLAEKIKAFIRRVGYSGMFSAEFLYSGGGKYYFLEVNLRNDGTNIVSTRSGYNLPDMLCRMLKGKQVVMTEYRYKRADYLNLNLDLHCLKSGKVSLFTWLKNMSHVGANTHFDWCDMKPFISYIGQEIRHRIREKA